MKIFYGINAIKTKFRRAVIAIGVFDGLHLGHQKLIRQALRLAKKCQGPVIVMTFDPHPVNVLRPENHLPLIMPLELRLKLLETLGVDYVVVVPFTLSFARLHAEEFIAQYLVKLFRPQVVIVGDDFRFGQNREGSLAVFADYGIRNGFVVKSIETQHKGRKRYSSTLAREAIADGQLAMAEKILGRPVMAMGRVVPGDQRGKSLGYPTANLLPTGEIIPPRGVYVCRVHWHKRIFFAMSNVGVRPSFRRDEHLNIEVHVLDFNDKLYGQKIVVEFLHKIRNEMFFSSHEALIHQLKKDENFTRRWFNRRKNNYFKTALV